MIHKYDDYYDYIKASEFNSIEDAMTVATENTRKQKEAGWGVTVVCVGDMCQLAQLPDYIYYRIDVHGNEVVLEGVELERYYGTRYHRVAYHNEWSKDLGMEGNTRLVLHYSEDMIEEYMECLPKAHEGTGWKIEEHL